MNQIDLPIRRYLCYLHLRIGQIRRSIWFTSWFTRFINLVHDLLFTNLKNKMANQANNMNITNLYWWYSLFLMNLALHIHNICYIQTCESDESLRRFDSLHDSFASYFTEIQFVWFAWLDLPDSLWFAQFALQFFPICSPLLMIK